MFVFCVDCSACWCCKMVFGNFGFGFCLVVIWIWFIFVVDFVFWLFCCILFILGFLGLGLNGCVAINCGFSGLNYFG